MHMKGVLGVNARWWTLCMGLSGCSIIHLLTFIRHQPCAKWWARCFPILDALWSHWEMVEIWRVQITE